MSQNEEKVIHFSKIMAILIIISAGVFATLGLKLLDRTLADLPNPQQYLALGISLVCFVSAVGCGFIGFKMLLTSTPGLTINNNGLSVNSNGVNFGFIPWRDITAIQRTSFRMSKIILIDVKNPQHFHEKCNIFIRALNWLNPSPQSTPIKISAHALKIPHQDLLPLLQDYHIRNQP